MIMAVKIGPDGGVGVEILAAMDILQHRSPAPRDHDGFTLQPVLHLRERMPEVAMIQLGKPVHVRFTIYDLLGSGWNGQQNKVAVVRFTLSPAEGERAGVRGNLLPVGVFTWIPSP